MRLGLGLFIACLFTALTPAAKAACDPSLIPNAVVARVTRDTIDKVLQPAQGLVPEQVPIPNVQVTLSECPLWFDDTVLTVERGNVRLTNQNTALELVDGGLVVDFNGDLDVTVRVHLQLCALPDTTCNARVIAHGASLHTRAQVSVAECSPQISLSDVHVAASGSVDIDVTDCPVYDDIFSLLDDWFHDKLVSYGLEEIQNFIPELVATQVEAVSSNIVATGTTINGVDFRAQPQTLTVDSDGISGSFAVISSHVGIANCVTGIDWRRSPAPADVPWPTFTATSIGISQRFVQNTLENAWRAGWLCIDLKTLYPAADSLVAAFGTNTRFTATASTREPPRIDFVASDVAEAKLTMDHLEGHVHLSADDKPDLTLDVMGGISVKADARIKTDTNQIVLAPKDVGLVPISLVVSGQTIGITQAAADAYVNDEIMPLLVRNLVELPIISALFETTIVPIDIKHVYTTDGAFIAEAVVGAVDTTDTTPPQTTEENPPQCPCGGTVEVDTSATDNSTPVRRMRYLVEVDGRRDTNVRFGSHIVIEGLDLGPHTIRIAAVDAMGNEDPVGVTYTTYSDTPATSDTVVPTEVSGCNTTATSGDALIVLTLVLMLRRRRLRAC